jgi:hypothetical protein
LTATVVRSIDAAERRARLGRRHHLATPADDVVALADALCGLHSSDPATVYLSARARMRAFETAGLDRALYDERSLVRMLGMRRTLFVVSRRFAAVMDAACTKALGPAERRRLVKLLEDQGIARDGPSWLERVMDHTMAALSAIGEATANELREVVPELQEKLTFGEGKRWGGTTGVSTRILFLLATEGAIVRGRPLGTWLSSQYRWAPTAGWLGEPLPELDPDEARIELARRWLATFGPGTFDDFKWWTGWGVTQTRRILSAAGAIEVSVAGGPGYVLADDVAEVSAPHPWVTLLPSLDPTVMGWKAREWYLGPHAPALFDRNGNAGPTVWCDGRVVGGWSQRPDGEVIVGLLEDIGAEASSAIDDAAADLSAWFGGTRLTPRFRTPLEKEIAD